jgi:hemerythrin-like metal-binding protein
MTIAHWSRRFETGIDEIDDQHRNLFEALNRLAEAFRAGESERLVQESLDSLMGYTLEHFRTEEKYMNEWAYPGLAEHVNEHARLVEQAKAMLDKFTTGKSVTMEVTIFLADLLKHHINDFDMRMVRFKKERDED